MDDLIEVLRTQFRRYLVGASADKALGFRRRVVDQTTRKLISLLVDDGN